LYFKSWPFRVVPERSSEVWADRKRVLSDLNSLAKDTEEKDRSSICIVWGYVGAGKSHSLFHLKGLTEKKTDSLFIISPMPKEIKKYADLYQYAFLKPLSFFILSRIAGDVWSKLSEGLGPRNELVTLEKISNEIAGGWIDFAQAIANLGRIVSMTGSIRNPICLSVEAWLSGARLSRSELRSLGISNYLKEETDFVRATSSIIRLLTYRKNGCPGYKTIFWVLDDAHYLATLKTSPKAFNQIQQGLRDTFDGCPNNLCIILSFAARDASKLDELLVEDLTSRVSRRIHIPPLNDEEAFEFTLDLINSKDFKKDGNKDVYFPYSKEAIQRIIQLCKERTDCTPRNLMKVFEDVTIAAENEIYPNRIEVDFVLNLIKDNKIKVD
jgi:hypothetical protein